MPAIQPARLKIQISQLADKFSTPYEFVGALKGLLEFYADRTRKPGMDSKKFALIQIYNPPKQVSRQIEVSLRPMVVAEPEQALTLVDILWDQPWLECRAMALTILGWIPPEPPERVIGRLKSWSAEIGYDRVLEESLARGLEGLWKGNPDLFFNLLESWLKASDPATRRLGLRVLPLIVTDPSFKYLPNIFSLLRPFLQRIELAPDTDILLAIRALAKRSPQETAYFLRRNLALTENVGMFPLIRRSLDAFPPAVRRDLQAFLHQRREDYGEH